MRWVSRLTLTTCTLTSLADIDDLARVGDAAPGHIGDVQQAVHAAEIDKRAVLGDVFDHALDDVAFFELADDLRPLLGAALFKHSAARHDDVAAAAIHLQNLEGLNDIHQAG